MKVNDETNATNEIMAIESIDNSVSVRDELQVNIAVGEENVKKICEAYESCYLGGLQVESAPNFEMSVVRPTLK